MVGDEVDLHVRGKFGALEVFDEFEDDALMWGMGYPHGAGFKVLVLFITEVVGMDASSQAV
jgi:hypothetical protein